MRVGIFGSLAPKSRGRPRKGDANDAPPPSPIGVGTPPWLPVSARDIARRQAQCVKLRRNLLELRPVLSLSQARQSSLIEKVTVALDTWATSSDALWHQPRVPIEGALRIAAQATGDSLFRPEWRTPRGRKPKPSEVRFLLACVDAWETVAGKRQLWRVWQAEQMNKRKGTFGSVLRKPVAVQIAAAAWQSRGHKVPDTKWPGLIDNALKAGNHPGSHKA